MSAGTQTKPVPYCPDCGAQMKLRRPPRGARWKPFWGCGLFPDCSGKRQIDEDGRPVFDEIPDRDMPPGRV